MWAMTATDDLYASIYTFVYHYRCSHSDTEVVCFQSSNNPAYCPQCQAEGKLIGYDRYISEDRGEVVYTPL